MSSTQTDAQLLASPLTYHNSGVVAPNRFLKSAMTERLCTWDEDENLRGYPTPAYNELYRVWGKGAIGTIIVGNVPVDRRYPEAIGNAIIDPTQTWNQVEAFKPMIRNAKAEGSVVIVQLTHAGRQTSNNVCEEPVSSSDVQTAPMGGMTFNKPRPMTVDEITDLIKRFAFAAKVLYDAGADGVQLHAAHGYLLSQFLSPRVNKRTDHYGGSFQNRTRLLFELVHAIREIVPDRKFIISIKINSADFSDGGFTPEESKQTVLLLEAAGMDLIELSGGTYESRGFVHKKESTKAREAYFIEFAAAIQPHLTTAKLAVTGGFRSTPAMAQAIRDKACDIVGLARPLTAEPDLAALLIESKKSAAKQNLVPEAMQTGSSIMQLHDIGNALAIRDLETEAIAAEAVRVMLAPKA